LADLDDHTSRDKQAGYCFAGAVRGKGPDQLVRAFVFYQPLSVARR
jgi:hypothetical protein